MEEIKGQTIRKLRSATDEEREEVLGSTEEPLMVLELENNAKVFLVSDWAEDDAEVTIISYDKDGTETFVEVDEKE